MKTKYFRGSNINFWLLIPISVILISLAYLYNLVSIFIIIILLIIILLFVVYNLLFVKIKGNQVHIPGFELRENKVSNSYYYAIIYPYNAFIYNFNSDNIKRISIVDPPQVKDNLDKLKTYYLKNRKKVICIEFKKSIRGLFKGLFDTSISDFPDLDKIYFSVARPEKLVEYIKSLMKNK